MVEYKDFEYYIKNRKGLFNIPELQMAFNCSYKEIKKLIDTAVNEKLLVYTDGLNFEFNLAYLQGKNGYRRYYFFDKNSQIPEANVKNEKSRKDEIKELIWQQGTITVPQIQKEFNLNYSEACKIINGLVEEKFIVYNNGLEYQIGYRADELARKVESKIEDLQAFLEKKREELFHRFGDCGQDETDEDNDDEYNDEDNDDESVGWFDDYGNVDDYDYIKRNLLAVEYKRQQEEKDYINEEDSSLDKADTVVDTDKDTAVESANDLNGINPMAKLVSVIKNGNPIFRMVNILIQISVKKQEEQ